jgi:Aspartyl protease
MAKISSNETSPTIWLPEDIRILTFTADAELGGKPTSVTAFADTGSDHNVIFKGTLDKLRHKIDPSERPIVKVVGSGREVRALGKVQLCFWVEEQGECYTASFLVLPPQDDFDVLLGWPFLSQKMGMGYQKSRRGRDEKSFSWLRRA